jgi:hypothetical protein
MLALGLFTASLLLFAFVYVMTRALDYVRDHPEAASGSAVLAYEQCQTTLRQVIARSREIGDQISPNTLIAWQAPNGHFYTVSRKGVEEHRPNNRVYYLEWPRIGGVGVRLQPGFKITDASRDSRIDTRRAVGYSFILLIVPLSGDTITIPIPTYERPDAVDFVAQTLALAGYLKKRVNVFGFNKPPSAHRPPIVHDQH